ncbi:MAG: molecular chaperone TorD [Eggerthellaceae bacterium]|nr:molecular chaperone TorD [Eggerthellaceae bacterium]
MTVTADTWQARAALCELLALSFRYPDDVLVGALASGEWGEAAEEIAGALDLAWPADGAPGAAEAAQMDDPDQLLHALRAEATRLFVGSPEPACSPYEGVWRAQAEGVQPLLFVNPHSMDVERFCKACGLGRPEGTNEPLDHIATEMELLEYLALRAAVEVAGDDVAADEDAGEPGDVVASADLPGGSPEAAYAQFLDEHVRVWVPDFVAALNEEARLPFYPQAGSLLTAFVEA